MMDYKKLYEAIDVIHEQALLSKKEESDDFNYGLLTGLDRYTQKVLWHLTRGEKGESNHLSLSLTELTPPFTVPKEESKDLLKYNPGDQVEFIKEITFGQDMQFFKGYLSNIVFTVRGMVGCWVCLEAPGYGVEGNYGNGAIYVLPKELYKASRKHG